MHRPVEWGTTSMSILFLFIGCLLLPSSALSQISIIEAKRELYVSATTNRFMTTGFEPIRESVVEWDFNNYREVSENSIARFGMQIFRRTGVVIT